MKEKNNEFIVELDKKAQEEYCVVRKLIVKSQIKIVGIEYVVDMDTEILSKFGLNSDIRFVLKATPDDGKIIYYYKNIEVNPLNYYVRPIDYHEVSTLRILQECITQDTFKPNIRYLERGEESNDSKKKK